MVCIDGLMIILYYIVPNPKPLAPNLHKLYNRKVSFSKMAANFRFGTASFSFTLIR